MNYVYDILVNFKYPLLDFFEWNADDNIENIKRIPFFKVSSDDLNAFKYNKYKIDDTDSIKNGIKLFDNKKKTYNGALYTDGNEAIVIRYDNKGVCIAKSSLLLDEEMEIIDSSNLLPTTNITYKIISKDSLNVFKTRKEVIITKFLITEIGKIDDVDKLNYINYECFDEYTDISKQKLINTIKNSWDDKYYKIYDFLHSISLNKIDVIIIMVVIWTI